MRKKMGAGRERSEWRPFIHFFASALPGWIDAFRQGAYVFSPMKQISFADEAIRIGCYLDRLILHFLLNILKCTFVHVISLRCMHLAGPSVIGKMTREIKAALATQEFYYFCRMDIKSYYASVDHDILLRELHKHYDDPIVLNYLEQIITSGVDIGGSVVLPTQGIALRSSLSPFFGALYLTALDKAFDGNKNVFYYRYMDDIILFAKTKRQYTKARKSVFKILRRLKLTLSECKSSMGSLLKKGFHYLGVSYEMARTSRTSVSPEKQAQQNQVRLTIHPRTCKRALDKVTRAMDKRKVSWTLIQRERYPGNLTKAETNCPGSTLKITRRYRWTTWWHHTGELGPQTNLMKWVKNAEINSVSLAWIGSGLLLMTNPVHSSTP